MKLVLSIDGGGAAGYIPALVLAAVEARTGRPCADTFDMIAGTSIGGILASALAARVPATQLVALLHDHAGEIFSTDLGHDIGSVDGLAAPKYSAAPLERYLAQVFGDKTLADVGAHLMVPTSLCGSDSRPYWFQSWTGPNFRLRDIARATSAAPYYFPPAQIRALDGEAFTFADGGLFANNPEVDAALAAAAIWPGEEIFVLSLGCGYSALQVPAKANWGGIDWLKGGLIEMLLGLSVQQNIERASVMGHSSLRLDPPCGGDMDDVSPAMVAQRAAAAQGVIDGESFALLLAKLTEPAVAA